MSTDIDTIRAEQAAKLGEEAMGYHGLASVAGGMPPDPDQCEIMAPLETAEAVAAGTFEGQTPLEMAQQALAGMGFQMGTPTLSATFEAAGPSIKEPAMQSDNNLNNIFSHGA